MELTFGYSSCDIKLSIATAQTVLVSCLSLSLVGAHCHSLSLSLSHSLMLSHSHIHHRQRPRKTGSLSPNVSSLLTPPYLCPLPYICLFPQPRTSQLTRPRSSIRHQQQYTDTSTDKVGHKAAAATATSHICSPPLQRTSPVALPLPPSCRRHSRISPDRCSASPLAFSLRGVARSAYTASNTFASFRRFQTPSVQTLF